MHKDKSNQRTKDRIKEWGERNLRAPVETGDNSGPSSPLPTKAWPIVPDEVIESVQFLAHIRNGRVEKEMLELKNPPTDVFRRERQPPKESFGACRTAYANQLSQWRSTVGITPALFETGSGFASASLAEIIPRDLSTWISVRGHAFRAKGRDWGDRNG